MDLLDDPDARILHDSGKWIRRGYHSKSPGGHYEKGDRIRIQEYYNYWMKEFGGENMNVTDKEGRTALMHAIVTGDHHLVESLLKYGIALHTLDQEGHDALWYLCQYLRPRMLEMFLRETVERHRSFDLCGTRAQSISFRNELDYLTVLVQGHREILSAGSPESRIRQFADRRNWGKEFMIHDHSRYFPWLERVKTRHVSRLIERQKRCVQLLFEFGYSRDDLETCAQSTLNPIKYDILQEINRRERQRNWGHWKQVIFNLFLLVNLVVYFLLMMLVNELDSLISPFLFIFSFHLLIKNWIAISNWIGTPPRLDYHQERGLCVFIPIYRESEEAMRRTIHSVHESLEDLDLKGPVRLVMVVDGADEETMEYLEKLLSFDQKRYRRQTRLDYDLFRPYDSIKIHTGVSIHKDHKLNYDLLIKENNVGKRDSQLLFIQYLKQKYTGIFPYVLFVDSDIYLDRQAIRKLYAVLDTHPDTMAICGTTETETLSGSQNMLSRYQRYEYRTFHVIGKGFENSSLNGFITCLPGCCSMFRMEVFNQEQFEAYAQNPLNVSSTSKSYWFRQIFNTNLLDLGEDRYFTTLTIKKGLQRKSNTRVRYQKDAVARTICPTATANLIKQRRRWYNSTFVNLFELVFDLDMLRNRPLLWFSVFLDFVGMIIAPASITFFIFLVVFVSSRLEEVSLVTMISLLLVLLSYIINFFIIWSTLGASPLDFLTHLLMFPMMHVFLPIYSIWNIDNSSWGTRQKTHSSSDDRAISAGITLTYLIIIVWVWLSVESLSCHEVLLCGKWGQIAGGIVVGLFLLLSLCEYGAIEARDHRHKSEPQVVKLQPVISETSLPSIPEEDEDQAEALDRLERGDRKPEEAVSAMFGSVGDSKSYSSQQQLYEIPKVEGLEIEDLDEVYEEIEKDPRLGAGGAVKMSQPRPASVATPGSYHSSQTHSSRQSRRSQWTSGSRSSHPSVNVVTLRPKHWSQG